MALTINPAVSRKRSSWAAQVLAFAGGALLGTLVCGVMVLLVVAALETMLGPTWLKPVLVTPVALAVLSDLRLPVRLPYRNRQVPEWLRNALPQGAVAFTYGFMLGLGFLTLFTYSSHVAMLAALPTLDSFPVLVAVVVLFAVGKTLVLGAALGVETLDQVDARFTVADRRLWLLRLTTAATSVTMGVVIVMQV